MSEVKLKYLFTAEFANGDLIDQNEDDKSTIDPEKRSAFFDILEREKSGKPEDKLIGFHLQNQETKDEVSVNLINGDFIIKGVPFYVHDKRLDEPPLKDFRLIYFRKHTHNINQESREELSHDIAFRIGWQTNHPVTGENVQRIIEVS